MRSGFAGKLFDKAGNDRSAGNAFRFRGKGLDDPVTKYWLGNGNDVLLTHHVTAVERCPGSRPEDEILNSTRSGTPADRSGVSARS